MLSQATRTETASRSASKTASVDVAEVLAVGLERQRLVARDPDRVDVVRVQDARQPGEPPAAKRRPA